MSDRNVAMSHKFMIRRVSALLLGTAAGAFAVPAMAQVEPPALTIPDFDAGNVDNAGTVVVNSNPGAGTFNVDVTSQAAVMIYNSFDLGVDATAGFTSALAGNVTVVNRVNAGNPSDIYGSLTSGANVHLWLINLDGITFGSTGSFSGASLLLSTLPFGGTSADLVTQLSGGPGNVGFARTDLDLTTDGMGLVAINSGSTLNSTTGNMVLIGERITVGGSLTADDGSVVMVGAREVTFSDIGSPLSFSIVEGVRIEETDAGIAVTGDVEGNSVVAAVGSQGGSGGPQSLMETVLSIEPGATLTATEVDGTVVLATATTATSGTETALIANGAGVSASIEIAGPSDGTPADPAETRTLVSDQGGITIQSQHDVSVAGVVDIAANGAIDIAAAGGAALGNVTGEGITLTANNDLTFADLDANTQFATVTSVTGNITGGDVTTGTTASLSAAGGFIDVQNILGGQVLISAMGDIQFASSNSLALAHSISSTAGDIIGGDVTSNQAVTVDAGAGRSITLGDVTAPGLTNFGSTVLSANAITLGTVVTTDALDVQATNDITFAGLTSTSGGVNVSSSGGGDVLGGGNISSGAAVFVNGSQTNVGDITAAAGNITIFATSSNISTGALEANGGNVGILAAGNITTGSITANQLGMVGGAIDVESIGPFTFALGALTSDGDIDLDTTGAMNLSSITSQGDLTIGGALTPVTVTFTGNASADAIDINATGLVTALNMTATQGNLDVNAGAIGAGAVSATEGDVILQASGNVTTTSITSNEALGTGGGIFVGSTTGDVDAGDISATGSAFIDAGATNSITLGNVVANSLSNFFVSSLLADSITFDTITTTNELYLIADDGDITGNTIRTDGADIRLTATDEVLITGAFTALTGDPLVSGSIGIFAGDNVGSNAGGNSNGNPPQGNLALEAGEDIAILSSGGSIYLTDVLAGDDVFLDATAGGGGNGTVAFDRVELTNMNVDLRQTVFGAAAGQPLSVSFALGEAANQLSRTLVVDARKSFLGDIVNVPGDLIITATEEATFSGNVDVLGDFIVTGTSVILGQNNQTRTQTATGLVNITATDGDIIFLGDLTLQSNADGMGGEGLFLTSRTIGLGNGDIGPAAGDTINLIGGTALDPSPVVVELDGNFTATSITADSLSIADGLNPTAPGSITVDVIDVNQSLELRSANGAVTANTLTVNDAGASLTLASGGAGSGVISDTSLSTNGGDILLASEGDIDVALVTTTLTSGAPPAPTAGSITVLTNGNAAVSGGLFAGEDAWIRATGNIGSTGAPVVVDAGDDIFLQSVGGGDLFVASATTDGGGNDDRTPDFSGTIGALTNFSSVGEFFPGAQILITGGNLFGPAFGGSTGNALILRDLTVGSADIEAQLGDIRIGDLSSTVGDIGVDAAAGSVSGLQTGWTATTGGSAISAPGNIQLQITGAIEVGTLTGAAVSNISSQQIRIGAITAGSVTLTGVDQLQIDSGTVTGAATLTTTGGTAGAFALTGSPPVANHGVSNLTAAGAVTVNALTGAAQLGTVSGTSVDVSASAIDLQSATTTLGAINATANTGQLTLGTASSATTLTLDKTGVTGALTVNGALTAVNDLSADSSTTLAADSLVSNNGGIALTSTGDTTISTAQADNGAFTSAITVVGDFAATSITAQSVAITDGANAWAPGNITADTITSEQALALRTNDGTITLTTVSTSNMGASLTLAAGGAGQDLVSTGSITTNGGDLLLSATDMIDVALASTSTATPTAPTAGTLAVSAGGNVAISDALYAGEDLVIDTGGDLGTTGNLVTLDAGDDILVDAAGDVFLASAITDGGGIDLFTVSIVGGPGRDANLLFAAETAPGAQIQIAATNISGDPVTGSGEDALIVRDLSAGSASLTANLGDIRIGGLSPDMGTDTGGLTASIGDIDIAAATGSVSSLADGWVAAAGGPVISAPGDIVLDVTGTAAIGSITGAAISNTSTQSLTIASIDASSVTLSAVDRLHIDNGTVAGAANLTTTGGTATAPSLTGSPPVQNYGWADVAAAGGVTVSAPVGAVQLNTVVANGGDITIVSDAAEVLSAISAIGGVSVTANNGQLSLVDGDAAGDIVLVKTGTEGALTIGTASSSGGDITASSSTGASITSATATTGNIAVSAADGDASLGAGTAAGDITLTGSNDATATTLTGGGDLLVTAGNDGTVDTGTMGGSITIDAGNTASGGALSGNDVTLSGFAVNATTVDAGSGALTGTATGGDLFIGSGTATGTIALTKTGDIANVADGITSNALTSTAGDILLDSSTFVNVGSSNAAGLLSIVSPDTIVAASLTSDGSIALNTGGDAQLGDITAGVSLILLAAGDISADTLAVGEDIAALSGGSITIGDFTAGDNVTMTAATTLDLGGGSTTGGGADNNTYILDLALAGTGNPNAITDGPADAVDGDILLEAPDDFALTGTISVAAADGTLTVRNLAGGAGTSTSVGTTGGFEISEAEFGFLTADNVVVDSGDQPLALGSIAIGTGTGTGSLQFLSSGDITISGVISGAGTGILQIGVGEIGATGLVDPATLSTSITATTETAGVDFAGGIVDLRAMRIVFGLTDFVALAQGASLEQAALLVTDGGSQLYIGDNSQNVFMQADTLRVAYSDFALFQNTSFSLGGGAILNGDGSNSVSELALELFSQGDGNLDSFAIFGQVNGFTGRTAGVLPNAVLNIGTLSPRELRVTQARSRVNGCVIGSPDRGCLIVDLPPPEITTIDERQAQDLISTDDPSQFLNPLVGRGNEGLILDIAQIPVGIDTLDCDPEDETCELTEPVQ